MLNEELIRKWDPILEHGSLPKIANRERRLVTAQLLENTHNNLVEDASNNSYQLTEAGIPANMMGASSSTAGSGNIDTFDPILISLVRRSAPNLIAYDIAGVQPMTGPTGMIFALRSKYGNQGTEALYQEANTAFSSVVSGANTIGNKNVGTTPGVANNVAGGIYNYGGGMSTAQAEALGTTGNTDFAEMSFSVEKSPVEAKSRALKAEYTIELAQDLRRLHGLEAETELSNMLSSEILAEINRELLRTINITAVQGSQTDTTTAGIFDLNTDSDGRWSVEKFKGMIFRLDREANQIAKDTRRGKGNFIICSSDVASALQAAGVLDYTPALAGNNLAIDDTGSTFAGVLNSKYKVYIDPYATGNYFTMGYKGVSSWDAGVFYCPYIPLQLMRAVDPSTMQPKIGFKTRYGMVANPFAEGWTKGSGRLVQDSNLYYRRTLVTNLQ